MSNILLNKPQLAAVQHINGPCMVLAGAGTGKTRVIIHRIANLIQKGINPSEIVAVTFTNKAANEMKERLNTLLGTKGGGASFVGTFHSFCMRLLKKYAHYVDRTANFTIQDMSGQQSVLRQTLKELQLHNQINIKMVQFMISEAKNNLILPEAYSRVYGERPNHLMEAAVYKKYVALLKIYNSFDFDDLILEMYKIIKENPLVSEELNAKYRYYLVDEFQDTNRSQFALVEALVAKEKNLFVVGDDDQSIYSWRGADPLTMLRFTEDRDNAKLIKLEQNYRSTNIILDAANSVIHHNSDRIEKKLWSSAESQEYIQLIDAETAEDEARLVIEDLFSIKRLKDLKWSDFAVIYRTNQQSRGLEEQCRFLNIPYRVVGGQQFFDKKEVKDALAYLSVLTNPYDDLSMLRIINFPSRGLGLTTIEKLMRQSKDKRLHLFKVIEQGDFSNMSPGNIKALDTFKALIQNYRGQVKNLEKTKQVPQLIAVIRSFFQTIKFDAAVEKESKTPTIARKKQESSQALFSSLENFFTRSQQVTLLEYVNHLRLNEKDEQNDDKGKTDNCVTLLTLHSAKGLEYENVYLVGMEEGLIPHERSIKDEVSLQEERRLCYVGITRAKKRLVLSKSKMRSAGRELMVCEPSRFLDEIPQQCFISGVDFRKQKEERKVASANLFFQTFLKS